MTEIQSKIKRKIKKTEKKKQRENRKIKVPNKAFLQQPTPTLICKI